MNSPTSGTRSFASASARVSGTNQTYASTCAALRPPPRAGHHRRRRRTLSVDASGINHFTVTETPDHVALVDEDGNVYSMRGAIGRSDHSVLDQLQPLSAPPLTSRARAAEGQQTLEIEPMQSCVNQPSEPAEPHQ
jgi:hypothetical protein